jgi:hypothetical protein
MIQSVTDNEVTLYVMVNASMFITEEVRGEHLGLEIYYIHVLTIIRANEEYFFVREQFSSKLVFTISR